VIVIDDAYADLLARGSDGPLPWTVDDELAVIAINYTSGTTCRPKGAMCSHRAPTSTPWGRAKTSSTAAYAPRRWAEAQ